MKSPQIVGLVAVLVAIAVIIVAKAGSTPSTPDTTTTAPSATAPQGLDSVGAPVPAAETTENGADATDPKQPAEALPALLELGSVGCKPCEYMAPIIDSLAEELKGKVDVTFTDVAKAPDVAKQYEIVTIPTQVFLDAEGKELFRHIGVFEKEEILAKLKELGMLKE